jgi:type I restriction enzyme M protein
MNLYLHGIGGEETPIKSGDSLISDPGDRYDLVITNPPNGREEQTHIQWE